MRNLNKVIVGTMFLSAHLVAGASLAADTTRAAVLDKSGNFVRSSSSKQCVRTKWEIGNDPCTPKKMEYTKTHKKKNEPVKFVTKEHKRSYIVFFDLNKFNLSPDASDILSNLYNDVQASSKVSFQLTGHADRTGSDAYNMALSKNRAMAVQNALVSLGADTNNITINWKGESEPLIPTSNGINEPQNRRTEIRVTTETVEKQE